MTGGASSRERAAAALGVPPDAPPEAVRAALLRKLPAEGFVPPEEWTAAANVLAGAALPLSADARAAAAEAILPDVEAFAAVYWSLPPADRRARWADLTGRCPGEPAAGRLRQLEAGLDVPGTPHPDAGAEEIAALVRELFLLPPRARAVRRAEWLVGQADRFPARVAAARLVLRDAMPLAQLEPRLFEWFTEGTPPVPVEPIGPPPAERQAAAIDEFRRASQSTRERDRRDSRNAKTIWSGGCVMVWVVLILIRAVFSLSSPGSPRPTPTYSPPGYPHGQPSWDQGFTREELDAFYQYEKNRTGPEPDGYLRFRLMGGRFPDTSPVPPRPSGPPSSTRR